MRTGILISAILIASCSTVSEKPLHENSSQKAPTWSLVSFNGLEDSLRHAYETKTLDWVGIGTRPIKLGEGVSFEDFSQIEGKLTIHGLTSDTKDAPEMHMGFQSCNGIKFIYKKDGQDWVQTGYGSTMRACERMVKDRLGKMWATPTPMYVDDWFSRIGPSIKNYEVSLDGQTLHLLGDKREILGVFERMEAAE